jgi:hypothetical protein
MFYDYPAVWAATFVTREQRSVIAAADGRCQLQLAGCTTRAVTTNATLPRDSVRDQQPACKPCADYRAAARR